MLAHLNVAIFVVCIVVRCHKEVHQDSLRIRRVIICSIAIVFSRIALVFDQEDPANIFLILRALLEYRE